MHLLAIDTATRRVGVALGSEHGVVAALELGGADAPGPPRHAEELVPAIELLTRRSGVPLDHLSAVAVSIGPGAFTGLRVGVTTASTIAAALRVPVVAVPSLDLLAYPLRYASTLIVGAIDARRREVYYAVYRPVPGGVQRETDDVLATPDDLAAELEARGEEALLCGDGALRFAGTLGALDHVHLASPAHAAPSLAALVELAASRVEREEFANPAEVRPRYLRRSDAELAADASGSVA